MRDRGEVVQRSSRPGTRELVFFTLLGLGAACGESGTGATDPRGGKAGSGARGGTGGESGEGSGGTAGKAAAGSGGSGADTGDGGEAAGGAGGETAGAGGEETAGGGMGGTQSGGSGAAGGAGTGGAGLGGTSAGGSDAGNAGNLSTGGAPMGGGGAGGAIAGGGGSAGAAGGGAVHNMFVMFDRSGSMHDCVDGTDRNAGTCPSPPSRWDLAAAGLRSFLQDPAAADLGIALRFFPHDEPAVGCTGGVTDVCDAAACAIPLVDLGRLTADAAPTDAHEATLSAAIDAGTPPLPGMPSQGTPTYAALDGALRWAVARRAQYPDETTVVVFVTDGEPNGCINDFDDISQLAADALAGSGVTTYMIGLIDSFGGGVNQVDMDQVAAAGGTTEAYYVTDPDADTELLATLHAIRSRL